MKQPNSQYRYIRHGYCRRAYKVLWGSQSTSDLRIFGVRKPISDVKTPKTSTSASAVTCTLTLQETQSIHDFMNLPKMEFIAYIYIL